MIKWVKMVTNITSCIIGVKVVKGVHKKELSPSW